MSKKRSYHHRDLPGSKLEDVDWSRVDLTPFQKKFYDEAVTVRDKSSQKVRLWREVHNVNISGENPPKPISSFAEAGFPSYIMKEIKAAGFVRPTPIQSQGWPMALCGRDVVGIAETGSGKTLAFLLPALVHINAQPMLRRGEGPIVLIVVPTRELAHQIKTECDKFGYSGSIKNTCVYGGVPKRDQVLELHNGVEVLIATPGRLLDHLEHKNTNLKRVTYFVLDEADRMLDMGFESQLRILFRQIRPDRQLLLWSATWPREVRKMASNHLSDNYLKLKIGNEDENTVNKNVIQHLIFVEAATKQAELIQLFMKSFQNEDVKVLIFLATKYACDKLCKNLRKAGWPALAIHGDKTQRERDWVMEQFRNGESPILIATDLASRGIHIDDINFVVNYDFPHTIEDYIHRIGRTGRAGKKGTAISFFEESRDCRVAKPLLKHLERCGQDVPRKLERLAKQFGGSSKRKRTGGYRPY